MLPILSTQVRTPLTSYSSLPQTFLITPDGELLSQQAHLAQTAPLMPYKDGFGDLYPNPFRVTQSPSQFLDFAVDAVNHLPGVEIERPVGQVREVAVGTTFVLGVMLASLQIYHEYSKLALLPGKAPFHKAIKDLSYYLGISLAARLGTDGFTAYQRTGGFAFADFTSDVLFSMLVYWAIFSPVWPWITKLSFPFSGPFMKAFNPKDTFRDDFIVSGGKFHRGTVENVRELLKPNGNLGFTVNAEHVAKPAVRSALESLADKAAVVEVGADYELLMALREKLIALPENLGISFSINHTTAKNISKKHVEPGQGTLLKGSVIRSGDKRVTLHEDLVLDATSGGMYVYSGVLQTSGQVEIGNSRLLNKFYGASAFTLKFEGPAKTLLEFVSDNISKREISGFKYHPLNATPDGVRQKMRRNFAPTPLKVTLKNPLEKDLGEQEQQGIVQALKTLATQKVYASRLKKAPTVSAKPAVIEWLIQKEKATTLDLVMPRYIYELTSHLWGSARVVLEQTEKKVVVRVPATLIATVWRAHKRFVIGLAKKGKIKIQLPNELRATGAVWKISDVENIAMRTKFGSWETLKNVEDRLRFSTTDAPGLDGTWERIMDSSIHGLGRFVESAGMMVKGVERTLSFGRVWSILALTSAGFLMSASVTSTSKFAQGFRDPHVYVTSGMRVGLSRILNAMFGPGIVNLVGTASFSNFKYFIPSVTWLTVWEMFNEVKEIEALLYKQKISALLGEDRQDKRHKLAEEIIELEEKSNPALREDILSLRLANLMQTGVYKNGDGKLLKKMYEEGKNSNPKFAPHFLFALGLDESLMSQILNQEPEVVAFFDAEFTIHRETIKHQATAFLKPLTQNL